MVPVLAPTASACGHICGGDWAIEVLPPTVLVAWGWCRGLRCCCHRRAHGGITGGRGHPWWGCSHTSAPELQGGRTCETLCSALVGLLSARTPKVTPGEMLPPTLLTVPLVPTVMSTAALATAPATAPALVSTTAPATAPALVSAPAVPLSLSSTPGSMCNTCPEEWISFQRKCYYFGEGAKRWIQARYACNKLNGRLVSIHNQEEQVGLGSAEGAASMVAGGRWSPSTASWTAEGPKHTLSPLLLLRTSWPNMSTRRAPGSAFGIWT